jgi:hypothetical protein
MKLWYKAVCDKHHEACNVMNNHPSLSAHYLGEHDAEIEAWLTRHYGCELRLVWRDDQLDAMWKTIEEGGLFPKGKNTSPMAKPVAAQDSERKPKQKTVCVDFDGVLHSYTSPWTTAEEIPDPPVPGALEFLTQAVQRFKVVVFSTRGKKWSGCVAMQDWLSKWGLPDEVVVKIGFTATKPPAVVYIDDRAWHFKGTFPTMAEIDEFKPWNKR